MQLLWGYDDNYKRIVYILSIPIVKRFQAKKLSPFLGQILTIFGNK